MLGRFMCWWKKKHLRGRLVSKDQTHKRFECPRCGRATTYPIKAQA